MLSSHSADSTVRTLTFALKTNLLFDALLVPNIGAEFYLGDGWTVGAMGMFAWWSDRGRDRFERVYGGEVEGRRYFGSRYADRPLSGHHVGVYAQMLTYDLEWGGTGYLSDFSYGVGVSYGYLLPLTQCLNIDFSLGLGYFGGKYKKYKPSDGHYVWQETLKRNWWGPTKLEVSLVWIIGGSKKKGGCHE